MGKLERIKEQLANENVVIRSITYAEESNTAYLFRVTRPVLETPEADLDISFEEVKKFCKEHGIYLRTE